VNSKIGEKIITVIDQLIQKNIEHLNAQKKLLSVFLFVTMSDKKGEFPILDVLQFELFPFLGFSKSMDFSESTSLA
jgi:hypothetical protein